MVEEGEDWKDVSIPHDSGPLLGAAAPAAPSPAQAAQAATKAAPTAGAPARANLIGPAVKLLLATHGLEASQVILLSS